MRPEFHLLPTLDKVTASFDKLYNTDLFSQLHAVSIVQRMIKGTQDKQVS